jgi:hypothetical protein
MQKIGTILEVTCKPICNSKTTFIDLMVSSIQIRRSEENAEGVELSIMVSKTCRIDFEGWHTDPYIAREFHGVWGNLT